MENLLTRLRAFKPTTAYHRLVRRIPVNPDGKEAADVIEEIDAELVRAQDLIIQLQLELNGAQKKRAP